PRRVWDVCNNKVIPTIWLLKNRSALHIDVWPISHSWAPEAERQTVMTAVNDFEWPVPIPADITLEDLRAQLLALGCRYAWVDVLCLRQEYPTDPKREKIRREEWKLDVPLIGFIYNMNHVVVYFSGLGRPFKAEGWTHER
ncbi:hypothetical protein BDZ91DRAFT_640102, partial [Kalaharituber pfeilii]